MKRNICSLRWILIELMIGPPTNDLRETVINMSVIVCELEQQVQALITSYQPTQ